MKLLHRLLCFAARFTAACFHFGLLGAIRVMFVYRKTREDQLTSVPLKRRNQPFWFRRQSDRGTLAVFYNEGYRIADCYGHRARWIIDAGANIGDSTLRFRHFHSQAQILAIEADPDNHAVLAKNFEGDTAVRCLHRALWSSRSQLTVHKTWANIASRVSDDLGTEGTVVEACSIPDLMSEFQLDEIDILKLDIEGAESVVFQTADQSWMHRVRCIIFECCDADDEGTTSAIFAALQQAGARFNSHVVGENIILIRHDTPWHVTTDLWLEERPSIAAHIDAAMRKRGLQRLD